MLVAQPVTGVVPISAQRHVEACMGTVFSFHIAAPGVARVDLISVLAWLHDMDGLFSTYRSMSEVSLIASGRLRIDDAAPEVRRVLDACEDFRQMTGGYFDAYPDGHRLDPSGYVKGWAIQTASDMLVAAGSANHCVNGGGDVMCVGQPSPGRSWRIGIVDPFRRDATIRTIAAPGPIGVATSGLAERGAHIFDPHSGQPAAEVASVTIAAPDLITADVYATAAVAMGAERARSWLGAQPGILATLVTAAGEITDIPGSGEAPR